MVDQRVNKHTFLCMMARARNLEEAYPLAWGEAQKAKERFMNLPKTDREAIIKIFRFL